MRSITRNERTDFFPQVRNVRGEFIGSCRRFAAPEWNGRGRAMRVLHQNAARLNSPDSPGSVSQQHDVPSEAFYGEVFVNRADNRALGLRKYGVQRIFRNFPAASKFL